MHRHFGTCAKMCHRVKMSNLSKYPCAEMFQCQKVPMSKYPGAEIVHVLAGVCCGSCNPSKWEADIWRWLEVRKFAILHYTVNQRLHWACQQYGHSGGTREWLGIQRWQLSLPDTSRSAKCHRQVAVGHWFSFCVCSVVGWLIVYQLGILSLL